MKPSLYRLTNAVPKMYISSETHHFRRSAARRVYPGDVAKAEGFCFVTLGFENWRYSTRVLSHLISMILLCYMGFSPIYMNIRSQSGFPFRPTKKNYRVLFVTNPWQLEPLTKTKLFFLTILPKKIMPQVKYYAIY